MEGYLPGLQVPASHLLSFRKRNQPAGMEWANLPSPALLQVFRNLSVGLFGSSRLVCLVCSNWAAATTEIEVVRANSSIAVSSSLQRYLNRHGRNISKLHSQNIELSELCCPQLTDLLLTGSSKQLSQQGSKLCSDIAAATGLTRVSLPDIDLFSCSRQLISALASLSSLRRLVLKSLSVLQARSLLPACSRLTYLEFQHGLAGSALTYLSSLTDLQHLAVGACMGTTPPALSALQKLTHLAISELNSSVSVSSAPGFSQLTALQQLSISLTRNRNFNFKIDPAVLPAAMQLQHLEIRRTDVNMHPDDGERFLTWLGRLQHLTSLTLDMVYGAQDCPMQAWAAVTASTGLQHLDLSYTWLECNMRVTPSAVWRQVVFGPGKQLPLLRTLQLPGVVPQLCTADVQHLVLCCPVLEQLNLYANGSGSEQAELESLLQLSALTDLFVSDVSDSTVGNCLAQLTGLRQLSMTGYCTELTDAGFQQLTALKQLTCLGLGRCFEAPCVSFEVLDQLTDTVMPAGMHWAITSKDPAGCPPDAWSQLTAAYQKLGQKLEQG